MDRVLIIEDDENILNLEKDYLEANHFSVITATNGTDGLKKAMNNDYDLLLLDIMLPGVEGLEICQKVREINDVPIILVSAKKSEADKIVGLGYGADDYIIKPFSPSELAARVQAHINRYRRLTGTQSSELLTYKLLSLNLTTQQAFVDGIEISLTNKEFKLLCILVSNPRKIFSKQELFEKVWDYDSLGDTSTLTVHINRLREKLNESKAKDYIQTVWGRGYSLK